MNPPTWLEQRVQGFQDLAILRAAVDVGLIDALARGGDRAAITAGLAPRVAGPLLDALCWLGIAVEAHDHYALTPDGASLIAAVRPQLAFFGSSAPGWLDLAEAARTGVPRALGPWPAWGLGGGDPHLERTVAQARAVAVDLGPVSGTFMDLGCGGGEISAALLRANPDARGILVDRAPVVGAALQATPDLSARMTGIAADLFVDPLPGGADLVVLANILHSYPPADGQRLLARAVEVARPGGRVVVRDLAVDRTGSAPRTGVDFAVYMGIFHTSGGAHAVDDVLGWMRGAGVQDVRLVAEHGRENGCFLAVGVRGG